MFVSVLRQNQHQNAAAATAASVGCLRKFIRHLASVRAKQFNTHSNIF